MSGFTPLAATDRLPAGIRGLAVPHRAAACGLCEHVRRALKTWTAAAAGRLTLDPTASAENADIRVRFVNGSGNYGETLPRVDPRTRAIVSAQVVINGETIDDTPLQSIVVYLTAL